MKKKTIVLALSGLLFAGTAASVFSTDYMAAIEYAKRGSSGSDGSINVSPDIINIAVPVAGVRSVNDLTDSDFKLTLEMLDAANRHYDKEDGMTEYFFRGNQERKADNLPTSLSWLINNNIITRDKSLTVTSGGSTFPNVTLTKEDYSQLLLKRVTKTEFISALYRAVYGPIQSRGVGLHFTGFRTVNGSLQPYTSYKYDYKPQGDYVLKNYIEDATIEVNNYLDLGVEGGNGGSGGDHGQGGDGGDANVDVTLNGKIETYQFQPVGDTLYYFTNDIAELYVSAALNKGILDAKSDNIKQSFLDQHNKSRIEAGITYYPKWDTRLNPLLFGNGKNEWVQRTNVKEANIGTSAFGSGYIVNGTGNSMTITRVPEDNESSALFSDEYSMTRMDVYRYIYNFLTAGEKVMSELESEIVSYKYSARFDDLVKDEDIKILQFLTAKGILNFDGVEDYRDLYTSINWDDVFDLLYRVANKDARFDFSAVQLTDSDRYWQRKGFASDPIEMRETNVEHKVTEVSIDAPQTETASVLSSLFGVQRMRIALFASKGFDVSFESSDVNQVYFDKLNFDANVISLPNDTLDKLAKESVLILSKTGGRTGFSQEVINAVKEFNTNNKDANLNFDWFDTSNQTATAERVLGNVYYLFSNRRLGTEGTVDYDKLYGEYKDSILAFTNLKAGTSKAGAVIQGNPSHSKFSLNLNGMSLASIFSTSPAERVIKTSKDLTAIKIVYNMNGQSVFSIAKQKDNVAGTIKMCVMSNTADDAKKIVSSRMKNGSIASTGTIVAYTNNNTNKGPNSKTANAASYVTLTNVQAVYPNIIRISDTILKNTTTGSYAYIHPKTNTALVGTEVMTTCDEPIIKESGELSYDLNIIVRLLPSSAIKKLDTSKSLYYTDNLVTNENPDTPVIGNNMAGHTKVTSINAINTLNTAGDPSGDPSQGGATAGTPLYGKPDLSKAGHGTYIYAPTVDGSSNVIYKILTSGSDAYAIAVLKFIPDTSANLFATMPDNPTLSEMMKYVSIRPTTEQGKQVWDRNIALSNAYANWFYGTNSIEYLKTGLLKPELSILLLGDGAEQKALTALSTVKGIGKKPTLADFQSEIANQYKAGQDLTTFAFKYTTAHEIRGAIWSTNNATMSTGSYEKLNDTNFETYVVSADKNYIFLKNRLYILQESLPGVKGTQSGGKYVLETVRSLSKSMMWDIGQTMTIEYNSGGSAKSETGVVTGTKGNYAIVQLSAVKGLPVYVQKTGEMKILSPSGNSTIDLAKDDLVNQKITMIKNKFPGITNSKTKKLASNPLSMSTVFDKDRCVVTNEKVMFVGKNSTQATATGQPTMFKYDERMTLKSLKAKVENSMSNTLKLAGGKMVLEKMNGGYIAYAYPEVMIPMTDYVVSEGKLVKQSSKVSDFMPPILFASLNKFIVDAVIDEATGAIPVNEIPDNAVLSISNAMYVAKTERGAKNFIGLTDVGFVPNLQIVLPTITDICKSFASCMINCGSQYLNVSQYFKSVSYADENGTSAEMKILRELLQKDFDYFYRIGSSGAIKRGTSRTTAPSRTAQIMANLTASVYGNNVYAWTRLQFEDGLMAYKISEDNAIPVYALLSHTNNPVYGDLGDIPFFDDKALEAKIMDKTTELSTAGFKALPDSDAFMQLIKEEFANAFKGDLYTLVRLIMFCILCWLLVASWICYTFMYSRLGGILDMLKYPTGERNARGFDLLKVISLGTISMETDFTIARFVAYDFIMAILIVFVWKLG